MVGYRNKLRRMVLLVAVMLCLLTSVPRADAAAGTLAVERQIYTYLTEEMGLSTAAACGVLANIEHESAFQPTVVGDKGTSFGLCQWHNERWTALRSYCSLMGIDYRTVEGQMEYLRYELGNNYTSLMLTLKSLDNTPEGAYRAAYLWCTQFERPANMEAKGADRGNLARGKYWSRYNRPSVVVLPEAETEPPSQEYLTQQLTQNPVTIPLPPEEPDQRSDRRYQAEKPALITYIPRHIPRQEPVQESSVRSWGIPALAAVGAAAVAVILWPDHPRSKKQGPFARA